MAASILYFHGKQLLVWALVVVGVVTVALIVLSIYLVKVCKKKLGKEAYWIASVPWLAILIAGFLFDAEIHQTAVLQQFWQRTDWGL